MNYRKIYINIIIEAKRKTKERAEKADEGQYFEKHHILPKSIFPKWARRKFNIVRLTAREHFICHMMLDKIYPDGRMFVALWRLANDGQNNYCVRGSRHYEKLREKFSLSRQNPSQEEKAKRASSIKKYYENNVSLCRGSHYYNNGVENIMIHGEPPPGFVPGRKISDTHRQALVIACERREYLSGENHPAYGIPLSEERRRRIGEKSAGHKMSPESIEIMRSKLIGRKSSPEAIEKQRAALKGQECINKGKKWFNDGKICKMEFECPEGFQPGRLTANKKCFNNGEINVMRFECPDGFQPGKLIAI